MTQVETKTEMDSKKHLPENENNNSEIGIEIDFSLITYIEKQTMIKMVEKHKLIIRGRAIELGFNPDLLAYWQKDAIHQSLSYEEQQPPRKLKAIHEKNKRLIASLSPKEKALVRTYVTRTKSFSIDPPKLDFELDYSSIYHLTEKYFQIMKKYRETVFEEPYYFFNKKEKKRFFKTINKMRWRLKVDEKS